MSTPAWKPDYTPIANVDARTAELVKDAFMYLVGDDDTPEHDMLFDVVHTMYSHVFPGASRVLTPEECAEHNRKLAAGEPTSTTTNSMVELHRITVRSYAEKLSKLASMQAMVTAELKAHHHDLNNGTDTNSMTFYQAAAIAETVDNGMLDLMTALLEEIGADHE